MRTAAMIIALCLGTSAYANNELTIETESPIAKSGGAISSEEASSNPLLSAKASLKASDTGLVNVFNKTGNITVYFDLRDTVTGQPLHYQCNYGANPYCQLPPTGLNGERILASNINVVFYSDPGRTQRIGEFFPLLNTSSLNATVYDNHLKLDQVLGTAQ